MQKQRTYYTVVALVVLTLLIIFTSNRQTESNIVACFRREKSDYEHFYDAKYFEWQSSQNLFKANSMRDPTQG